MKEIENIELKYLSFNDYQELKDAMIEAYTNMPNSYWKEHHIKSLIKRFPEGQVVVKVNNEIAGCALSIVIKNDEFEEHHGVVGVEQRVVDAGVAAAHRALDDDDGLGVVDVEDGHAVDGRSRIRPSRVARRPKLCRPPRRPGVHDLASRRDRCRRISDRRGGAGPSNL